MFITEKIRLYPTEEQIKQFKEYCNASRFVYNACLAKCIDEYQTNGIYLQKYDIIRYADSLKYDNSFSWLNRVLSGVARVTAKDLNTAFDRFYKGICNFPKYKKKGKASLTFGLKSDLTHCRFADSTHLRLSKINGLVRIRKHLILNKIYDPRVYFDNKFWYISFSYEIAESELTDSGEVIGVDLGVKELATLSNGLVYHNINKSRHVQQLLHRKKRLQHNISRKYKHNQISGKFVKTNNIIKLENEVRLIDRKIRNIRDTYIHTVTAEIAKTKPYAVVIEDLDVKSLMRNKYMSKYIQEQCFNKFRRFISYKGRGYGFRCIVAERFYASSKLCSSCSHSKKFLALDERTYVCRNCGLVIDRDLNAAINLELYGKRVLAYTT